MKPICFYVFSWVFLQSYCYSQEYKYKNIAEKFRDGKFDKSLKLAEEEIAKNPNEMLPYLYKAMSIYQGKDVKKITSKYPNLQKASLEILKEAKPKFKPGDSIPNTFLVTLNDLQLGTYQEINRALKKKNYESAKKTLDEHYTLFDNSDVLFESYIYPNLTKTCNDLLALKETEKKEELFDLLLGITKTYTANIQKSGQTVKTLFLLKRLQQTIKTGMDALLAKKLIAYVEKWSAFLTSTFNASSEKARNYYAHMLVFPKTEGISKPHPATSALYANTQEDLKKLLNSAYYFEEWNKPEYRMAYTGKYASYLTKDEKAVLLVMNLCRLDPVLFEKTFVKKYLERHPGELGSYSTSLINTLKKGNKALPYLPDSVLFLAAQLHAKNYGELGKEGHGGLYGDPDGRAKHFGYIGTGVGESCDYGMSLPEEIVLHLLVDKDVPGVGHRLSIITQEYVAVGISIQPHTQYGTNCVIDLTD